jgi:hypothetical protein
MEKEEEGRFPFLDIDIYRKTQKKKYSVGRCYVECGYLLKEKMMCCVFPFVLWWGVRVFTTVLSDR